MDRKKYFVHLLMLFLFLFFLLSRARPELMAQRVVEEAKYQVLSSKGMPNRSLVHANERMEIEINDYPGSGANNRHDPRNPGRP
ncbi:Histone acetyltransferase KAT6A [Rhynchospora pubera]|uniref:Histone acetyltransferase KAT6A n=1 Tax=Rhynchospora pubera TaxID=906938 RepID=A0AAV8DWV9_9POAL|nr:Histone acetyltransferase KAT6A [Rhynchospora pubera]KAJ4807050.1 Histone acetyltransferase KAT6A [Rhynchospora pubera]